MILISTLPDKGEESLDLQSPLTTSPNLDNCISTPLPEQLVDSDDRHGFLTGRCGRHRQRSHTLCMLMASGEAQPLYKYAHATSCTVHRRPARSSRAVCSCCSTQGRSSLFTCFHYMFFNVTRRTSAAIEQLIVSPVLGVVLVEFANGYSYEYTNVSRRAIANLLMNRNMSLGFWVNQNCINTERTMSRTLKYDLIPA